jgi:hypothetical protein
MSESGSEIRDSEIEAFEDKGSRSSYRKFLKRLTRLRHRDPDEIPGAGTCSSSSCESTEYAKLDSVAEALPSDVAEDLLRAAYPNLRRRANAARWLGWLAYQMSDRRAQRLDREDLLSGVPGVWRMWAWRPGTLALALVLLLSLVFSLAAAGVCLPLLLMYGRWHLARRYYRWACSLPRRMGLLLVGRLLGDAVAGGMIVWTGGGLEFRDAALRAGLAARYRACERERAARAARATRRMRLLAFLTDCRINRIQVCGAAAAAVCFSTVVLAGPLTSAQLVVTGLLLGVLISCVVALSRLVRLVRWTVPNVPVSSRGLAIAAVRAAAVLAVLIAWAGPFLAAVLAAVLPAAFVAACGLWVFLVIRRALARRGPRARRMLRYLPDAVAAITIGVAAAVPGDQSLLTTAPAAALLFPVAAWGIFRAWRAMSDSGRVAVRCAADLALALMLGAELTLLVVWLANMLGMSRDEVLVLRAALERAGALAELRWRTWTVLFLVLAAASVAAGRWPDWAPKRARAALRLPVGSAVTVARRVLSGVHIGLLAVVLVAVAAPAGVTPLLRSQASARYAVAFQRELEAARVLAVYTWIRDGLKPGAENRGVLPVMVSTIYGIGHPSAGDVATGTEADLARRLGYLQETTLGLPAPPQAPETGRDDGPSLKEDLATLDTEEQAADAAVERGERFGDRVAIAIASAIPGMGDHEMVQIVREYLSELVEGSPLKDAFAVWFRRHITLPSADKIVVPDAARLKQAALAELKGVEAGLHVKIKDDALTRDEPQIAQAVDEVNDARYLQQEQTGPCDGCRIVRPPGTEPVPPDDPHIPVDPEPGIPFDIHP